MQKYTYLTDRERAEIRRLTAAGFSYNRTGQLVGRSHVVVRRVALGLVQRGPRGHLREVKEGTAGMDARGAECERTVDGSAGSH